MENLWPLHHTHSSVDTCMQIGSYNTHTHREKDRQSDRQTDSQTEKERERSDVMWESIKDTNSEVSFCILRSWTTQYINVVSAFTYVSNKCLLSITTFLLSVHTHTCTFRDGPCSYSPCVQSPYNTLSRAWKYFLSLKAKQIGPRKTLCLFNRPDGNESILLPLSLEISCEMVVVC